MDPYFYPMQAIRHNEVMRRNQRFQACRWFSPRPSAQSNPSPSPISPLPLAFLLRTSIPDPDHPAPPTHPSWLGFSPRHQGAPSASGHELPSLAWQEEWVDRLVAGWAPDEESLAQEARRQQGESRRQQDEARRQQEVCRSDEEMTLVQLLPTPTDQRRHRHRHQHQGQPSPAPPRHTSCCAYLGEPGREKEGEWLCLPSSHAQGQSTSILLPSIDRVLRRRNYQAVLMRRAADDGDGGDGGDVVSISTLPSTPFRFNVGAAAFTPRAP